MTFREEGEVYYSERAGQFYQRGRRGAVSRERGLSFARYDPEGRQYLDQRGNVLPEGVFEPVIRQDRKFFATGRHGEAILTGEWTAVKVSREQAIGSRVAANESILIRTQVRTPDGRVHTLYTATAQGQQLEPDFHDDLAKRKARAELGDLGYELTSSQVGNATISTTYLKRTITSYRSVRR